jgi:hypothetical protein
MRKALWLAALGAVTAMGSDKWALAAVPVARWEFEGNYNDSINGYHFTGRGTPSLVNGQCGTAVDFDGGIIVHSASSPPLDALDRLSSVPNPSTFSGLSVMGWLRHTQSVQAASENFNSGGILQQNGWGADNLGWSLSLNAAGWFGLSLRDDQDDHNDSRTAAFIPENIWTHFAVTWNGATNGGFAYYINGSPVGWIPSTSGVFNGLPSRVLPLTMGGTPPNAPNGANEHGLVGQLDDVSLWNGAMTAGEVQADYFSRATVWDVDGSGTWSTHSNWRQPISPDGAGKAVWFAGKITSPQTVTVDGFKTVGALHFDNLSSYTLGGSGTLTLDDTPCGGPASLYVARGSHTISAAVSLATAAMFDIAGASSALTISGPLTAIGKTLAKLGQGTVQLQSLGAHALSVNEGTVKMQSGGPPTVLDALSISAGARLDLTDNDLVVNDGNFTELRAHVETPFGDPAGSGIVSSTSTGAEILALFDNALVGVADWPPGSGQAIGTGAIVGLYTILGDLNLDRRVSGDDYTVIDANLNTDPPVGIEWIMGDATLDGLVTGDDYTVVDANLGLVVARYSMTPSLINVPEPGAILAVLGLVGMKRRRGHLPRR